MPKLNYNGLNMPDLFQDAIRRGAGRTFVYYMRSDGTDQEVTFSDIEKNALILLDKLRKAGLHKGDRIGVICAMRPYWYSITYACLLGGFIMVCIDPGVPQTQMQAMALETQIRAVCTSLRSVHLPQEYSGRLPVYSIEEGFPLLEGSECVDILLDSCSPMPDGTFFVLFSSGTTGETRKAVLIPHTAVTTAIEYGLSTDSGVYRRKTPYTASKRNLILFPPYHIAGLLCTIVDLYCNTQIIIPERLTPNAMISGLQKYRPDTFSTVPSVLSSLYGKIKAGYSGNIILKGFVNFLLGTSGLLRRVFGWKAGRFLLRFLNRKAFGGRMKSFRIGASPFDFQASRFYLNMGIDVNLAYGLTELGAPLACSGQGYYPGTTGRVVRHTDAMDIRIVNIDETGRGEVEVLSPIGMISYLNSEHMKGCFTDDGYFRTGDLGYFDKRHCLVICGRSKECMVLRNGEKLLPEEIESKYQNIDAISEVAVFKVPADNGCDSFAIAVIQDKARALPDASISLRIYERAESLPPMYRPSDVFVLKDFPRSSSRKIQRFRLTEMAVSGQRAPVTDASLIPVDEDELTSELRSMLVTAGGPQWKTEVLTQGLLLNLDSLSTIDLYVAIQELWDIDLFQASAQPDTFGALYELIRNYDSADKTVKNDLDLSKYPLPVSKPDKVIYGGIEKLVKKLWHVGGSGQENIPTDGNFLICSNHRTVLDPSFITLCMPSAAAGKTCIVGKADLVNNPVLKKFVTTHNIIPIDRTGNSLLTLDRCRELLNDGWNVLIFPEGTNFENNTEMFPFKEGAVRLSVATGKPIVPCHISGIAHVNAEMNSFKLPPTSSKVRVKFGKPILPGTLSPAELNIVLRSAIEALQ